MTDTGFCPKQKCDLTELLEFFLDLPVGTPLGNISPSRLLQELRMPLQDRLDQLSKPTRKRRILTKFNTFDQTPDVVVFQNFEQYKTYKTTLTFINKHNVSRNLRLRRFVCPYFDHVSTCDVEYAKIAPGMNYVVTIIFNPTELRDYYTELICDTNEETIVIPIYGLGPRPLFKIVDEIKMIPTAIRIISEKSVLIHNLGIVSANYTISLEEPFDIFPKKGVLEPNQVHELKISCKPLTEENFNCEINILCGDISLKIPVVCEIAKAEICFLKQSVEFCEVFVGLQNYKNITIFNKSPFTIDFKWKLLETESEDVKKINNLLKTMEDINEMDKMKFAQLEYHNIINHEAHQQILNYKFCEYAELVKEEFKLLYDNENFSIIPLEGKILPNQSFDFTIIFSPKKNDVYLSSAYLDVTGKTERLHMSLSGIGKGPCVVFNVNKLNIGNIFLEAIHEYQIVVKNEGCIPATVIFLKEDTEFGGVISCSPLFQHLKRIDSCKTFILKFSSSIQGPFIEKVHFKIKESQEMLYFLLVGNVVCPVLKPNVDRLDFGEVAFGTHVNKEIVLTNDSQVSIDFLVKMSKVNYSSVSVLGGNADFTIEPTEGVVEPFSDVRLKIALITNKIHTVSEKLLVLMYRSDLYKVEIPVSYISLIPEISCDPEEVYITFCFIQFEYTRTIQLKNETNLHGNLQYTPLNPPENMNIRINPTHIEVTPHGVFEIDLTISTDVLGLHTYPLMFTLDGQEEPVKYCIIKCNGQGPVVSYFPDDIYFGKVQLLTKKIRKMSFVNDSPIRAKIYLSTNNKLIVQLPVDELELPPECEENIEVICYLTEDGKFNCQIFADVEYGENIVLNVSGEGIGHPILCEPNLEPEFDMGTQLNHIIYRVPVVMTNLGRKYFRLHWSRKPTAKSIKELNEEHFEVSNSSFFYFEPKYLELGENQSQAIEIVVFSKNPNLFEEYFYMYAQISKSTKIFLISTVLLKVKFVIPSLTFSSTNLNFIEMHIPENIDPICTLENVIQEGHSLESVTSDQLSLKNEVDLALKLVLKTTTDFFILNNESGELVTNLYSILDINSTLYVTVVFKPQKTVKRYEKHTGKLIINIQDYPKTESVHLLGERCYPSIQFYPSKVDFGCLQLGTRSYCGVIIQNITFLPVKYSLEFSSDSFDIEQLPTPEELNTQLLSDINIEIPQVTSTKMSEGGSVIKAKGETPSKEIIEKPEKKLSTIISESALVDNDKEKEEKSIENAEIEDAETQKQTSSERQPNKLNVIKKESLVSNTEEIISNTSGKKRYSDKEMDVEPMESLTSNVEMKRASFDSQNILTTYPTDRKIVQKTAKELLTGLFQNTGLEEEPAPISRDFWVEMKQKTDSNSKSLKNMVMIEPWRGCLKPFEYNLIGVSFVPPPNIKVNCKAICKIEGGEDECLEISGSCSNISFAFNKTSIDVGRKLFCEVFEDNITLTNTGFYEFLVRARCDAEDIFRDKQIKNKWLNVTPYKYFLESGQSVTFQIRYFAGVTGPFIEDLVFDIDFLEPIIIQMKGYSVFSQVILSLPRQEMHKRFRSLYYRGIGTITQDYLDSNSVILVESSKEEIVEKSVDEDENDIKFKSLVEGDWVIVTHKETMPSKTEIELAVERVILNDYLEDNIGLLKRHTIVKKSKSIPDFKVPAYRLNFGYVVVERPVCVTVTITNVSPDPTFVKLIKANLVSLYANEITVEFKPKLLGIGEATQMFVILKPSLKQQVDYDDKCIRDVMYLTAGHGATIPIVITATVALPRFSFTCKCVDFGMVKLGNAFRQTVVIENRGCLTCNWSTELNSHNNTLKNAYYVIPSTGELLAFDKSVMNIYFVPEKRGFYGSELIVYIQGSPEHVQLRVCGDGVQPTLVFKEAKINFEPTIPYTPDNMKELLIQNVSTFPIEFRFSDFEHHYDEEKTLLDLFLKFHNLKTVFIPERDVGGGIPEMFLTTYVTLENELRKLFNSYNEGFPEVSPLSEYNREQIVELIYQYIGTLQTTTGADNTTDIYAVGSQEIEGLGIINPQKLTDAQSQRNGVVLIFHGAPSTEHLQAAFYAAKNLHMDLYSIDRLICEELVDQKSELAVEICSMMDEALCQFEDSFEIKLDDDDYDILLKKIEVFLYSKPASKKKPPPKDDKKDSEKESSKKSETEDVEPKRVRNKQETLLNIAAEIWADILTQKFEKLDKPAIVIESLSSNFLSTPLLCLECLLHGIGNIKFIQVIFLSIDISEYITIEAEKRLIEEAAKQKADEHGSHTKNHPKAKHADKHKETEKTKGNKDKNKKETEKGKEKEKENDEEEKRRSSENPLTVMIKLVEKDIPKEINQSFKDFATLLTDVTDILEMWERKQKCLVKLSSQTKLAESKKGAAKPKKQKNVQLKFTNTIKMADTLSFGIPLLIINNAIPLKSPPIWETIYELIQMNKDLELATEDLKCSSELVIEPTHCMYTVFSSIPKYNKHLSDVFRIASVPLKTDDKAGNVSKGSIRPGSPTPSAINTTPKSAKRKKKLNSIKSDHLSIDSKGKVVPHHDFCPRNIMEPGEILKYEIRFSPQEFGVYKHKYRLEIIGYRPSLFIKCKANCELPVLDFSPETMFPNVLQNFHEKKIDDKFVYLKDEACFDFGTIILGTARTPPYKTKIILRNNSNITCKTSAILGEDSEFKLEDKEFKIPPGQQAELGLSLQGLKKGNVASELFLSTAKNPVVFRLRLAARICPLEFSVTPKYLNFDKNPLDYSIKHSFKITNSTPIDLKWKFARNDWATKIYKINKTRGSVQLYSMDRVEVEYRPTKEEINPKRSIEIQVFDPICTEDVPFLIDTLALESEAVAYLINLQEHTDLGEIKGKVEYKFPFQCTNVGKVDVKIVLEKLTDHPVCDQQRIRDIFSLNINSEVLGPQTRSGIVINFNPVEEMEFFEVPIFVCRLVDPKKENVVKSYHIKFSAIVLLSKFSICPSSGVHFGAVEMFNQRTQMLELKNIGKCHFDFNIGPDKMGSKQLEQGEIKNEKKKLAKSVASVTQAKSMTIDNFSIEPFKGVLQPGQSIAIAVTFFPQNIGEYQETIVLTVSEPVREHIHGKKITLHGEAAEPKIDFQNFTKMFKEHYIVYKADELVVAPDIGAHTYFVTSKKTLYFENVCVKKEYNGKIFLQNMSQVMAVVSLKILDSKNFTVTPSQITIAPYFTAHITVTFKPDAINVYEGKLELSYNAHTQNSFEICLAGRGYVPQIKLNYLPPRQGTDNRYKIYFKPTYLYEHQLYKFGIENNGVIPCQLIVDVTDSGSSMFYVVQSDTPPVFDDQHNCEETKLVNASLRIDLKPTESTDVYIVFKPYKEILVDTFINMYIVDNPFETNKIQVFGQCFGGDIHIKHLKKFNPKGWESKLNEVAYRLNFGYTTLNYIQTKRFSVTNNSLTDSYKFEFKYYIDTLKFIPKVGHLQPLATKKVLAVISSSVPLSIADELITLNYIPITLPDDEQSSFSWDERQQLLSWLHEEVLPVRVSNDDLVQQHFRDCVDAATNAYLRSEICDRSQLITKLKQSLDRDEPNVSFNSTEWSTIPIYMSFSTDFAMYAINVCELAFPDTFVRNKSEVKFDIQNIGQVPLEIVWKVIYDEITPKICILDSEKPQNPGDESSRGSCFSSSTFSNEEIPSVIVDPNEFEIIPKETSIPPMKNSVFTVIFSPNSANQYTARILSTIQSLHPDMKNIEFTVVAESFVPDYYFDLEDNDYMSRRTLQKCLKWPDANEKILEIQAVGVGITTIKRFCVMNTSSQPLNFKFEPTEKGNCLSYLTCKTPSGIIQKGKKFELAFAFNTQELGTFEEEYLFKIEDRQLETKFLIVGECRNPKVYFKQAHISLPPTLLKIATNQPIVLKNDEDEPFGFKFVKDSLYSHDHHQKLKIVPNSGHISAGSELEMQVTYNAEEISESTFFVNCVIDKMTKPLALNVSTKCLEVECKIQYVNAVGEEITLDPRTENIIDVGKIGIKTKNQLTFIFINSGQTGIFYTWVYNKSNIEHLINISPKKDKEFIAAGSLVKRELLFETFKKYNLRNFPMKIEISYGPTYFIKLHVAAEYPMCKLSFTCYNFGNCLVQPRPSKNYEVELIVKNLEPYPVKLDNLFEENENVTIDFKSLMMYPKMTMKIPFYFHPRKEGQYEFIIPLVFNCTRRPLKITGCGVSINLQLLHPSDKFIDFGEVKMGESKRYSIFIVNRSQAVIDTTMMLSEGCPSSETQEEKLRPEIVVPSQAGVSSVTEASKKVTITETENKGPKHAEKKTPTIPPNDRKINVSGVSMEFQKKKDTTDTTITSIFKKSDFDELKKSYDFKGSELSESQKPSFFITPKDVVRMDPNKKYEFILEFKPCERLDNFTQKVFYKCQEYVAALCSVKGKCLVPEYSLDKDILTFSNVLVGNERIKYVLLRNTGDLPIKFRWACEDHFRYFKINPIEGYVKEKSDIRIDFTFKTSIIRCQLVKKCKCFINNKYPLSLTCVANSINRPPPVGKYTFSCPVRQKVVENVIITNKTKTLWYCRPKVSHKNFIIPEQVIVEPGSETTLQIEYNPNQIGCNDEALFILPLPDEEILYEFTGIPLPPLAEKRLTIEIKSKQNHCEVLRVYNWTDFKQCFEVETILMQEPTPKTLYKTFGPELVDLIPGESKDYKWNIYVINEDVLEFQVVFKDKKSKEFMFYEIIAKVLPQEPIEPTKLVTCVREPVNSKIKLMNPINIPVTFFLQSAQPELFFDKTVLLQPYTANELEVTFFPLKPDEHSTVIEAKSEELGTFSYAFELIANPPSFEKQLRYLVELGSRETLVAEIYNAFMYPLDLTAKFSHPEFFWDTKIKNIPSKEIGLLNITFEPSELGILEGKATVSSPTSGAYIIPLYGECIWPKPKGPYSIKPGGGTVSINFFNPFNEPYTFYYSCESHLFELKVTSEEIKSKKSTKIIVTFPRTKDQIDLSHIYTSKMTVTGNKVKWIYYLQTE